MEVFVDQVARAIAGLPSGKAAGPDGIPNEILNALALDVKEDLARTIGEPFGKGIYRPHTKSHSRQSYGKIKRMTTHFQVATGRSHYRTPSRS